MTFILTINTDSAAFADDYRDEEIARILRAAADKIQYRGIGGDEILRDINGNICGKFMIGSSENPCLFSDFPKNTKDLSADK